MVLSVNSYCKPPYYNIGLDIDGVLASTDFSLEDVRFCYGTDSLIGTSGLLHTLPSGVKEFIRFLYNNKTRVTFYSAGDKWRNLPFVDQLLKQSLPLKKYQKIHRTVEVLSRENFDIEQGKDLRNILRKGDLLENTVLIDDKPENAVSGQTANFLHVPEIGSVGYTVSEVMNSVPEGFYIHWNIIGIDIMGENFSDSCFQRMVKSARRIIVCPESSSAEGWKIVFRDRDSGEICTQTLLVHLSNSSCSNVLRKIRENPEVPLEESELLTLNELLPQAMGIVAANNGTVATLSREHNRIYYVAGLLREVFRNARKQKIPLTRALEQLQNPPLASSVSSSDDLRYYHSGLELLRKFNPELDFSHPWVYKKIIEQPLSSERELELQSLWEEHLRFIKS